jgi:hypothetical protein
MIEVNNYDDHPEFADRLWYARSIVTLPERMRKSVSCHCGITRYDAFRTVAADEIDRLRGIIDNLHRRLQDYETHGSAPES